MKTVKATKNNNWQDDIRVEITILKYGAEVLLPINYYPSPRATIAPNGWVRKGSVCGPSDKPMQWWENK